MKQIIQYLMGIMAAAFLCAPRALAYNNWGSEIRIFSLYDVFFDIIAFSSAIVALVIGLQLINKLSGGLKSAWRYCMIIITLFIILQLMSLSSIFNVFDFSGVFSIIKFFMGIFFLAAILTFRNFAMQILKNKSLNTNGKKEF